MEHLVDGLYTQFVLRDFLGRVVPGAAFLVLAALAAWSPAELAAAAERATPGQWALAAGLAWVAANGLHWVQERAIDLWAWATGAEGTAAERRGQRLGLAVAFARAAGPHDLARRERFVVLRHATGTTGTALLAGGLAYLALSGDAGRAAALDRWSWWVAGGLAATVLLAAAAWEYRDQLRHTAEVTARPVHAGVEPVAPAQG